MKWHSIILVSIIFHYTQTLTNSVFIIVHGTWGAQTNWYTPGGDFFDALEKTAQKNNAAVIPFMWSGGNSNQARAQAAHNLTKLIEAYGTNTEVNVVAHSHGGTVALLTSQLLTKNKIFCLYTLGTPINKTLPPNMNTITFCYNLFSLEDLVQPVLGVFDREHDPHERIANIRVLLNNKEPDHSGLHDPLIGNWLPTMHTLIQNTAITMQEPCIIHFTDTQAPVCSKDTQRQELLERDHNISLLILHSLRMNHQPKKFLSKNINILQ